ncbi:MAG: glycerol-3-phosphate acyltransferase, partial [Dehalococcoidia bacterium]
SLAFVVACLLVGGVVVGVGGALPFSAVFLGAVAGALVELLSLPPDDNLTVPLAAGGVMAALA